MEPFPAGLCSDQDAVRVLAAMCWRVSRRDPRRARTSPRRSRPRGVLADELTSFGCQEQTLHAPVGQGRVRVAASRRMPAYEPGRGQVQRAQLPVEYLASGRPGMMRPETPAHQRSVRFGMAGRFISAERTGQLASAPRLSHPASSAYWRASLSAHRWYALAVEGGCLLQSLSRGHVGYGWRYEVL
jgi:hypothetical protein